MQINIEELQLWLNTDTRYVIPCLRLTHSFFCCFSRAIPFPPTTFPKVLVTISNILVKLEQQAILPIEQSIPRSTYIHPPAVNAAKGAF